MSLILKNSIEKLIHQQHLDTLACQDIIKDLLNPDTDPLQIAAFLVLLRAKGETVEELSAIISTLKHYMIPVHTTHKVLDIVGTGGDGAHTVNISTASSILAASCGVKIAKHGNRAVSSQAGSADVLEALGIKINTSPENISRSIDQIGIGFCFSPGFHPAMQALRTLRKQLNIPTVFNILGPLLNPANPAYMLLGVFNPTLMPLMAKTLQQTGTTHSLIVHGAGLDEISCIGPVKTIEIKDSSLRKSIIHPEKLGFSLCQLTDLQGGNAKTNAQILLDIFSGKNKYHYSAIAETLILNTAAAVYLYGLAPSLKAAIPEVREKLYTGAALKLLALWREFSNDK